MSRGSQQRRSRMCKGRSEVFKSEYPRITVLSTKMSGGKQSCWSGHCMEFAL